MNRSEQTVRLTDTRCGRGIPTTDQRILKRIFESSGKWSSYNDQDVVCLLGELLLQVFRTILRIKVLCSYLEVFVNSAVLYVSPLASFSVWRNWGPKLNVIRMFTRVTLLYCVWRVADANFPSDSMLKAISIIYLPVTILDQLASTYSQVARRRSQNEVPKSGHN